MSFDEHRIKVLNYQPNYVSLSGRNRNVGMAGSDGKTPSAEFFSFEDIEYINSMSPVLRTGLIEIEDDARDEVYKRLNINPDDCLYERDIDNMLLHPTVDSMRKIVNISDALTIERVRGHMAAHYSVLPQNVIKVVERRSKEIASGVRKTAIEIEPAVGNKTDNVVEDRRVAEMSEQIAAQNKQIAELTAMMQKLLSGNAQNEAPVKKAPAKRASAKKPQKAPATT